MKVELFPFQKVAVRELRGRVAEALGSYHRTKTPQVVSLQAPTGSGKTIIMATLIEDIFFGNEQYPEQPEAIFVWLSDSPALNEQSRQKIECKTKLRVGQCKIISDENFDQEMLEDGNVYFLNTQKLSVTGNLSHHSDSRQYTIWETLTNTAREKSRQLYFIIDEAHRGMQGRAAGTATTIMQRFIKGYPDLNFSSMPLVIGISATAQRFNTLVGNTSSTLQKWVIPPSDVRSSGLLKDRIVITYPGDAEKNNDMAVLQAACDEWKNKCAHWYQYSYEQHYAQVNPVFVIQVQAGNGSAVSSTPLDDVLATLEERIGKPFAENEVVHTFGSTGTLTINGLKVPHIEAENITEDKQIKVVLFKENLSTGWDCPRAETMMSFRRAEDITYIAQLLGRMIRTPLQRHIDVDESLNDVRLYLPYFNRDSVKKVIEELLSNEGSDIPTEIDGESLEEPHYESWSVHPTYRHRRIVENPDQMHLFPASAPDDAKAEPIPPDAEVREIHPQQQPTPQTTVRIPAIPRPAEPVPDEKMPELPQPVGTLPREEICRFVNSQAFLTFHVRSTRISSYLKSMLDLANLLVMTQVYSKANAEIRNDVVEMMHGYIEKLRRGGQYGELAKQVLTFKLAVRTFDIFGEALDGGYAHDLLTATESDLDRQLRAADSRLGSFGFPNEYGRRYGNPDDPNGYKIDCILFAADENCIEQLNRYAEKKFHEWDDGFRRQIVDQSEGIKKQYNDIVSNGDPVSKHNFTLPTDINPAIDKDGKEYDNHLFVNDDGIARIKLNSWEEGVLAEEMERPDFVCWLRNPSRGAWALTIPYELNGEKKPMYPDFIIIRSDHTVKEGYVLDILEPHGPQYVDNLGKAKGLAEYAQQEPRVGRIQLCREYKDALGKKHYRRLDLMKSAVREKVRQAQTFEELDHLFDTDGII